MAYRRSIPLRNWHGTRRDAINTLETAHATMGEVVGPGRPLAIGRPVAHAYVLRTVAEFQAYVRDLHDLAAQELVDLSHPDDAFRALLARAATEGRAIDYGNAGLRSMDRDFRRLGIGGLSDKLETYDSRWKVAAGRGDAGYYQDLIELRNALAHGNQRQLVALRRRGIVDTVTWTRQRLPVLNRIASSLDRVVWDYLQQTFGVEPW